jgi:hypothetical protein
MGKVCLVALQNAAKKSIYASGGRFDILYIVVLGFKFLPWQGAVNRYTSLRA